MTYPYKCVHCGSNEPDLVEVDEVCGTRICLCFDCYDELEGIKPDYDKVKADAINKSVQIAGANIYLSQPEPEFLYIKRHDLKIHGYGEIHALSKDEDWVKIKVIK